MITDPRNGSDDNILLNAGKGKKSQENLLQPKTGSLDINGSYKSLNPESKGRVNGNGSSSSSNDSNEVKV